MHIKQRLLFFGGMFFGILSTLPAAARDYVTREFNLSVNSVYLDLDRYFNFPTESDGYYSLLEEKKKLKISSEQSTCMSYMWVLDNNSPGDRRRTIELVVNIISDTGKTLIGYVGAITASIPLIEGQIQGSTLEQTLTDYRLNPYEARPVITYTNGILRSEILEDRFGYKNSLVHTIIEIEVDPNMSVVSRAIYTSKYLKDGEPLESASLVVQSGCVSATM